MADEREKGGTQGEAGQEPHGNQEASWLPLERDHITEELSHYEGD